MMILTKAIIALALGAAIIANPSLEAEATSIYNNVETEKESEKTSMAEVEVLNVTNLDEAIAIKIQSRSDETADTDDLDTVLNNNEADKTENDYESNDDNTSNTENKFKEIYEIAMTHASEILSLCAFIGSLVCAVIYKSGLLPMVENGLKSIRNVTAKIKEATDRAELDNKTSLCNINGRIDELEKTLGNATEALSTLAKRLEEIGAQRDYQEKISNLLGGEIDMLYDIFMSSNLPEYEKTRVGERVAKLKKDLNENEGE